MNTFSLTQLLVAAALVSATVTVTAAAAATATDTANDTANDITTTLRGSATVPFQLPFQKQDQAETLDQLSHHRRRLLRESTCTLFRKCVTLLPTEEHPLGHHQDSWVCELSHEDTQRLDVQFVDIVDSESVPAIAHASSGESTLTMSEAVIDTDRPRMFIPSHAQVTVKNFDSPAEALQSMQMQQDDRTRDTKQRQLLGKAPGTTGKLRTLVVRVTDKNGIQPTASVNRLVNDVFTDAVSLKTHTEACSYNKLIIDPFKGNTPNGRYISNGILDVKMDFAINSGGDGMDQYALMAANAAVGGDGLKDDMFDLVMFCLPPGSNDFIAFAFPNNKYSFYNDEWCGFVGAQMHEVGHNIGLAHSGEAGENEYGDLTGMMGGSSSNDDYRVCYNPQKNYQLGWYKDQEATMDPLDGQGKREYILNGVADYKKNKDALIVLRMRQTAAKNKDFYVGYNRKVGINSDVGEDANKVTIVRKEYGDADKYGQSTKVAALMPGQRHCLTNYNGQKDIQVAFIGFKGGDAKIVVTDNCNPLPKPPGSCQNFKVELTTDNYPDDNSWFIQNTGGWGEVAAFSPTYTQKNNKYTQTVCLPQGPSQRTFKFSITDNYGDGMCCGQGNGSYKIFDKNNNLLYQGSSDFKQNDHLLTIPKDPNPPPPTKAPTPSPTPSPTKSPECQKHTIEVRTDKYPADTAWKIIGRYGDQDNQEVAVSQKYTETNKLYTREICLQEGKFELKFLDNYAEGGICCEDGEGYYRLLDSCGNVIVDSGRVDLEFTEERHQFTVDLKCNGQSEVESDSESEDEPESESESEDEPEPESEDESPECQTHTVEVRTDNYPADTAWKIIGKDGNQNNQELAVSQKYTKENNLYKKEICLPKGKFELKFLDNYAEGGICCGDGQGYYRLLDSCGNVIVDSGRVDLEFTEERHQFTVDLKCDEPKPKCANITKKKFRLLPKGKKMNCKQYAKAGLCNERVAKKRVPKNYRDKLVSTICPKSCKVPC